MPVGFTPDGVGGREWVSGNIFIRPMLLDEVGSRINGHEHNFDHTSVVFTGSVHVRATLPSGEVVEKDFVAPAHFLVKAGVKHEIVAKAPNTVVWCVYAHRDPQGQVVQEYNGWSSSYV